MSSLLFGSSYNRSNNNNNNNNLISQEIYGGGHSSKRVREMPDFMRGGAPSHASSEDDILQRSVTSVDDQSEDYKEAIKKFGMEKAVYYSRMAVLCILLLSAVGLGVFIYFFTDRSELRQFEKQFEEDARKILEHVGKELDFTLSAADGFLVDEINVAELTNQTWPFVTTQRFAVRAAKLRLLTKALVLIKYPMVSEEQREQWEQYSLTHDSWVDEGIKVQQGDRHFHGPPVTEWSSWGEIHGNDGLHPGPGPYFPVWESYPVVPFFSIYNWDIRMHYPLEVNYVMNNKKVTIGKTDNLPEDGSPERLDTPTVQWVEGYLDQNENPTEPLVVIYVPILSRDEVQLELDVTADGSKLLGIFVLTVFWRHLIEDILPPGSNGISVVFSNTCGQSFTYTLRGPMAIYRGGGDLHDPEYNHLVRSSLLANLGDFDEQERRYSGVDVAMDFCPYTISVYPSDEMLDDYVSSDPVIFTLTATAIFLFTSLVFMIYDYLTRARQKRILRSALQNSAVVSSLFPHSFRARVLDSQRSAGPGDNANVNPTTVQGRLKSFLSHNYSYRSDNTRTADSGPIAEYFEEATVMFADISNFTAWSSVREPGQVFTLLEKIYGAFDSVAKRRGVYKVETIGDSYVAVAGVPEPRPDHCQLMVRFARDCRQMMSYLTRDLEITLGPGTAELQMRFGLNSGPVTAGVLRTARSRFQLFGDTVNTAACMEETGVVNKIHVTQATADLLIASGKQHWVMRRKETVDVKGKGQLQTYWVEPKNNDSMGSDGEEERSESFGERSDSSSDDGSDEDGETDKTARLVDWNVDILERLLRQVIANRDSTKQGRRGSLKAPQFKFESDDRSILEEFSDVIDFVEVPNRVSGDTVDLPVAVSEQLRAFVKNIADLYQEHPFHNFEHASHVSMLLVKLVGRVAGPGEDPSSSINKCYGLSVDPLAQFACVFAAVVHDVQHPGVSNTRLAKEGSAQAQAYEFRSIAEQSSIDVAWELLNDDCFPELRRAICATQAELRRFRQLVVNLVLATDILDADQRELSDRRWNLAFTGSSAEGSADDMANRKATILAEHLLQAADIGHCMQHWHLYRKWNDKLFEEFFIAHHSGRGEVSPCEYWYDAELAFFDDCVLPLARKLKDARIFGVSSEEYYNYALRNRQEWEHRGREVVALLTERLRSRFRFRGRPSYRMDVIAE